MLKGQITHCSCNPKARWREVHSLWSKRRGHRWLNSASNGMIFRSGLWGKIIMLFQTIPMQHCRVEKGRGKGLPRIVARHLEGELPIWYASGVGRQWEVAEMKRGDLAKTTRHRSRLVADSRGERRKPFGSISVWSFNPRNAISVPDFSIRVFVKLLYYKRFKRKAPTKYQFEIKFHHTAFSFIKLGNSAVEFLLLQTAAQKQNKMRHQHTRWNVCSIVFTF